MFILSVFSYTEVYTIYKQAEEYVCLLERGNLRKYWFDLKKYLMLDNPVIERGTIVLIKNVAKTGENYSV